MVLGADVRDRSGRLLLGSGTELAERHIYILRTWGVIEVEIAGAETDSECPNPAHEIDPARLAAIERKVDLLFRYANRNHPAIKELMRMRIVREALHGN